VHLLTTQTHDTKRSGDVRARIVALSWLGEEWAVRRSAWRVLEDPREDELLWQTLVGAWPIEAERLEAYMEKALREGNVNTSWTDPNEAHERAVRDTVRRVVADRPDGFETFAARVAELGQRIALGMTLLKLTVPGVPDLYQGDELESFNLVDPDNRRPVDWEARRRALAEPPPKLRLILEALGLRARRELGEYRPLELGPDVCAFQRGDDVAVVVPLRGQDPPQLGGPWRDLLPGLPVSLLERA
jgi:(1->4)-alpha-D-glucan 1-alpha-D-glucosylmutase